MDGDYLAQQYFTGAADMTSMNPEEELHLVQDAFNAGFGQEIFNPQDPKRYHVSNGMDFRNGQGILGWTVTNITTSGANEDFLISYTEVDVPAVLTVTASKITAVDCDRDVESYVYKDFGADYFDAISASFEVYISSDSLPSGYVKVAGFATTLDDAYAWEATSLSCGLAKTAGSAYQINLTRGLDAATDSYVCSANTLYYCTMVRLAGTDTASLSIYSDANRTTLLDVLSVAGYSTSKWRYCYGMAAYKSAGTGQDFDGYVQNLNLSILSLGKTTSHAEFNSLLYINQGAILRKLNATGDGFTSVKDFSSYSTSITDLKTFQIAGVDYLFIFLGTSNEYWYMNAAETFTESTAAVKTFQFAAWVNTTVDTMYANDGVNTVRSTINPLNGGTAWSAQTVVGAVANPITNLLEKDGALLIDKTDMPYYLSSAGAVQKQLAPECISGISTHSGKNSTMWQGEYFRPTGAQSLLRSGTSNSWIQPSKFGTNIGNFVGQVEAVAGDEEYLYIITDNSTKVEILCYRSEVIDGDTKEVMHPIQELTLTGCETAWISSVYKKRLWISSTSSSDSIYYMNLPTKYGDIVNDANASFLTGGTCETSWLHANFKSTNKAHIDMTLVMGHTYNVADYFTVKYKLLGGSYSAGVNYAGASGVMTQTQLLAVAATNRTSTFIKFQFTGVTGATTRTPILLSYDCKAVMFPTIKKIYYTKIRVGKGVADKQGGTTGEFVTLQNNCLINCRAATSWVTCTEYITSVSGATFYFKLKPVPQPNEFRKVTRFENNEPVEWEYFLLMQAIPVT